MSADFCIGYFNLRGWYELGRGIDHYTDGQQARILVGMYRPEEEVLKELFSAVKRSEQMDIPTAKRLKTSVVSGFGRQLTIGVPKDLGMQSVELLIQQIKNKKVRIKLFLGHPLHAKLYLISRQDTTVPLIGYVGSSNLTLSGLSQHGELNLDVIDNFAVADLQSWFDRHWDDPFSMDITDELLEVLKNSWVKEKQPYHIYLKMAYHLSKEAREGEKEFRLPKTMQERFKLLDFQKKAVSLAAYYLYRRGGVLLADVVGLGKTLMATAVAKVFEEDQGTNTLIICPANLVQMWEHYKAEFDLNADVISFDRAVLHLRNMRRFRFVIIDESHNLRNRDTKRYKAIHTYIQENDPFVLLLTATPYNKDFQDLGNQIRLFIGENQDLGIRPERFFQEWFEQGLTEADFRQRFQTAPATLKAFEQSRFSEDWRDLMRLFLIRRTRNFVLHNYAKKDEKGRFYLLMGKNKRFYFPKRIPKAVKFPIGKKGTDPYALLFEKDVVDAISGLELPRYALKDYLGKNAVKIATPQEQQIIKNLETAGTMLRGFVKSGLFKRLESSGFSFMVSVDRHILRNAVLLYAINAGKDIPIGALDPALLDPAFNDRDDEENSLFNTCHLNFSNRNWDWYLQKAKTVYIEMQKNAKKYSWIRSELFKKTALKKKITSDSEALITAVFKKVKSWDPKTDNKLNALYNLIRNTHKSEKILIFSQFADTANYLKCTLLEKRVHDIDVVTGNTPNSMEIVNRFSPQSNDSISTDNPILVLIATDVLSEGQNIQDAHIIVNYDLPWAIIKLIQRAGRVDRIGQSSPEILVYSFLPARGVDKVIKLRRRLIERLNANKEVIGADARFFDEETEQMEAQIRDLYTEKSGILDNIDEKNDVDLASIALQVWQSASKKDQHIAKGLSDLSYSSKEARDASGIITYLSFPGGMDTMVWLDEQGRVRSQSAARIFRAVACSPDTKPVKGFFPKHFKLIEKAVQQVMTRDMDADGHMGTRRNVRRKVYDRLKSMLDHLREEADLFPDLNLINDLERIVDKLHKFPLKDAAKDKLNRQIRLGITDKLLLKMLKDLDAAGKLFNEDGGVQIFVSDKE